MFKGTVIGRVTADLELRQGTKSPFVSFWVISNKGYGEKEKKQSVECLLFGDNAKRIINAKVGKGSLISIYGDIELTTYEGKGADDETVTRAKNQMLVLDWGYVPVGRKKEEDAPVASNKAQGKDSMHQDEMVYYDESVIDDYDF